ncbi:MAG: acetate kinase [Deltaproteobacteria bacterium]|nr:acetate kinase [Deltaproteobacteria bacterium]
MSILTLNCGSSSLKYSVFDTVQGTFICRGLVERIGDRGSRLTQHYAQNETCLERDCPDHSAAVQLVLGVLTEDHDSPLADMNSIKAVGHRVVHGGEKFARSAKVTQELIRAVEQVAELAPLHNPPNLAGIRAAQELLPDIEHVAVFDTAFHQSMPPEAYIYPLPYEWYEKYGIRRYGFHGTSHLYVSTRAASLLGRAVEDLKIVTLHVGNGASAAAVSHGKSIDTSMGFTPLEGLVMGTRCGWIDPAIVLYVMEREKLDSNSMDRLLNKKSGVLGISGQFTDRRDILKGAHNGDRRCQLAIEIESRSLKKTIGSYAAAMGGLDCVVFTAGVGENSALIRAKALEDLSFLGIQLDTELNEQACGGQREELITTPASPVKVAVIPTNEELVIAEDTQAILQGSFCNQDRFRYSFE